METHPNSRLIKFHALVPKFHFPNRRALKSFIARIFDLENVSFESLHCIFCTDEYLLEINKTHLSHDYFTDIITFNLAEDGPIVGELYISTDRVRENAGDLKIAFRTELLRVIFHGVLHLCGYGDSTPTQKKQMRAIEDKYLNLYTTK